MDGKRLEKEKRDIPVADVCNRRGMVKKRVKKEKRDKEMKVAVDRLWNITSARAQARYTGKERRGKEEVLAEACGKYKPRRQQSKPHVHNRRQKNVGRVGAATAALSRTWSISSLSPESGDLV